MVLLGVALDGGGVSFAEGVGGRAGAEVGLAGVGEVDAGVEQDGVALADLQEAGIGRRFDESLIVEVELVK